MSEDKLAIIVVFGSGVAIVVISLLFSLIKTWIKSRSSSYDDEKFDRLAKAFIQHKKETARRLEHLEATMSDDKTTDASPNKPLNKTQLHHNIEDDAVEPENGTSGSSKLRNMLNK